MDERMIARQDAPDYKCQSRSCDGVIWPPKPAASAPLADAKDERQVAVLNPSSE
jgi:hypothetical protein